MTTPISGYLCFHHHCLFFLFVSYEFLLFLQILIECQILSIFKKSLCFKCLDYVTFLQKKINSCTENLYSNRYWDDWRMYFNLCDHHIIPLSITTKAYCFQSLKSQSYLPSFSCMELQFFNPSHDPVKSSDAFFFFFCISAPILELISTSRKKAEPVQASIVPVILLPHVFTVFWTSTRWFWYIVFQILIFSELSSLGQLFSEKLFFRSRNSVVVIYTNCVFNSFTQQKVHINKIICTIVGV